MRFAKLYRESVKCYLDSIMMDRNHREAYWGLAVSYKYLTEYKKSIKMLEKLTELDENNDKYHFEIGVCYLSDGQLPFSELPHYRG